MEGKSESAPGETPPGECVQGCRCRPDQAIDPTGSLDDALRVCEAGEEHLAPAGRLELGGRDRVVLSHVHPECRIRPHHEHLPAFPERLRSRGILAHRLFDVKIFDIKQHDM